MRLSPDPRVTRAGRLRQTSYVPCMGQSHAITSQWRHTVANLKQISDSVDWRTIKPRVDSTASIKSASSLWLMTLPTVGLGIEAGASHLNVMAASLNLQR